VQKYEWWVNHIVDEPDDDKDDGKTTDRLLRDYDAVLRESALLTTFSGILFGFLLNISINVPSDFDVVDRIILLVALYSITVAVFLFIMPVIYHHLEYPYTDFEKFKKRSHRFMLFGVVPAIATLYLGLVLALLPTVRDLSFLLAAIPYVLVYIFFRKRK
jgi:4-hydroxybenzoate polyprenyltransferase